MIQPDDLPRAIPAMWRALKRGYQAEPRLLTVAAGLSLLSALPDAMMALWLMLLADGVASELVVSVETVRTHVRNAIGKLQARNRVHAIAMALERGEIALDHSGEQE
jgi:hypothetical protein